MCVDIEHDDERHYWTWEYVEESEDYVLLPARGHNYETDDYRTGEFVKIVKHLQQVAPHVRWRIAFTGSDDYGANPSQWRVICVPESQLSEAQSIFNRFLAGDNLDNYCYTDKYSEIYDKLPGQRSELKAEVVALRNVLVAYDEILCDESDLLRFVERMAALLPRVYLHANQLPYVAEAPDCQSNAIHIARPRELALSQADPLVRVYDPFVADIDGSSLVDVLASIRDEIEESLNALLSDEPDAIATAVNDLRLGFASDNGWGHDLLTALSAIHGAKASIAEAQRNDRLRRS